MTQGDILIVDDEPTNRLMLCRRLQKEGYLCREATSGQAALEAVAEQQPDLILLDVMMPDLDGFEVCRRLRSKVATRAIPIVLVTALSDRHNRVKGLEAGADDFLTKPVDPPELTARVRSLLRLRYFQTLSAQSELLEASFRDLGVGVVVTEPNGVVVACNRRARHLLDIREDDALGLDFHRHLSRFELAPPLAAVLAAGTAQIDFDVIRAGTPRLVVAGRLTRVLDPEGQPVYHALALRDVTDEREADRLRSDFLSLTAHKIRTPMTILRGLVELCDERYREYALEIMDDVMPDLVAKMDEVTGILDSLLRHDQLQAMREQLAPVSCELAECVTEAAAAVRERWTARPLTIAAPAATLPMAAADLAMVLRELGENTVKFGGDTLTVTADLCGEPLELRLSDNADGIPHEHFDHVFEACFQIDQGFTGQVPGLGIGLATVRQVVRAYGGEIDIVESVPRAGTVFRLRLPRPGGPMVSPVG